MKILRVGMALWFLMLLFSCKDHSEDEMLVSCKDYSANYSDAITDEYDFEMNQLINQLDSINKKYADTASDSIQTRASQKDWKILAADAKGVHDGAKLG